jgi:hypothetical protein
MRMGITACDSPVPVGLAPGASEGHSTPLPRIRIRGGVRGPWATAARCWRGHHGAADLIGAVEVFGYQPAATVSRKVMTPDYVVYR